MHIEIKQEVWWVQSLIKVRVVILYTYTCNTPEAILTVWLLKHQNRDLEDIIHLMHGFLE